MQIRVRSYHTHVEHTLSAAGRSSDTPLRKVAAVAVIENPYAGRYVEDLQPLIQASADLGRELAALAVRALEPYSAQSYGKAGIVGVAGEQEHANALLTTTFAEPLRSAIGGGKAWIASFTKRAVPGTPIDVPLAYKDALYVRSHWIKMPPLLLARHLSYKLYTRLSMAWQRRRSARVSEETPAEDRSA